MSPHSLTTLHPPLRSVELYTGLGGLAMGLEAAGLQHELLVEADSYAAETIRGNALTRDWPLVSGNAREIDFETDIDADIDVLAAGVPCQPFSQAGAAAGPGDARNEFPTTLAAMRALKPRVVLIENVIGLSRPAFRDFVNYVLDALRAPQVVRGPREGWPGHHRRLRKELRQPTRDATERYTAEIRRVRVADYGVPQGRTRVMIVAVRSDLSHRWVWPEATHSQDALMLDQLQGYYWAEHGLADRTPILKRAQLHRAQRMRRPLKQARWRTLRDALEGLESPASDAESAQLAGHVFRPGARLYRGHSGSYLDSPSKTIKAGVHGVAGGEHILHEDDGTFRYLTVRECMRVQGLPDELVVAGATSRAMRQIGNAVPPRIGEVFGRAAVSVVRDAPVMNRTESSEAQDRAAGGWMRRQMVIDGRRVCASVRLRGAYAELSFTRSAGNPIYLGRVDGRDHEARMRAGWERAHNDHPDLFAQAQEAA